MKFLSLKFNVRRVLIAVAVVGLLIVLEVGRRKRSVLLQKAEVHASSEDAYLTLAKLAESDGSPKPAFARATPAQSGSAAMQSMITSKRDQEGKAVTDSAETPKLEESAPVDLKAKAAEYRQQAAVHASIRKYYERAALFPWLPVARHPAETDAVPAATSPPMR